MTNNICTSDQDQFYNSTTKTFTSIDNFPVCLYQSSGGKGTSKILSQLTTLDVVENLYYAFNNYSSLINNVISDPNLMKWFFGLIGLKVTGQETREQILDLIKKPTSGVIDYSLIQSSYESPYLSTYLRELSVLFTQRDTFILYQQLNPYFYYSIYLVHKYYGLNVEHPYENSNTKQLIKGLYYTLKAVFGTAGLLIRQFCFQVYEQKSENCTGNCPQYIGNYLAQNRDFSNWCGCSLITSIFTKFKESDVPQVPLSCEIFCSTGALGQQVISPGTITANEVVNGSFPLYPCNNYLVNNGTVNSGFNSGDICTSAPIQCSSTICVIDDANVDIIDSQGTVTFEQYCSGCNRSSDPCICYIQSPDLLKRMTYKGQTLADPVVFKQVCPNAICYQIEQNQTSKRISCNTNNVSNTNENISVTDANYTSNGVLYSTDVPYKIWYTDWIIPIFIFTLFIVLIISSIYIRKDLRNMYKIEKVNYNS